MQCRTVNPSPPHLKGEMGPVVLSGVCVCVDSVCEHPLPLLASPRGGAWWSGLTNNWL